MNFEKKNKWLRYQIIALCLLSIGLISLFSNISLAWFKDDSITSNGEPNISIVGTLELTVTTNFNLYNLAFAPDTIYTKDLNNQDIKTLVRTKNNSSKGENTHDIDGAYVRIRFENERYNPATSSYISNFDMLDLYFNGNFTTATTYSAGEQGKWVYVPYQAGNADSNYYYYIGGIYDTDIMFNAGYKTTNIYTNAVEDLDVKLKFTVEAIQRQYGAYQSVWPNAPNIFKGFAAQDTVRNT